MKGTGAAWRKAEIQPIEDLKIKKSAKGTIAPITITIPNAFTWLDNASTKIIKPMANCLMLMLNAQLSCSFATSSIPYKVAAAAGAKKSNMPDIIKKMPGIKHKYFATFIPFAFAIKFFYYNNIEFHYYIL